jgi:hypothetical protein
LPTFSDGLPRLGDRTPAAAIDAEIIAAAALLGAVLVFWGSRAPWDWRARRVSNSTTARKYLLRIVSRGVKSSSKVRVGVCCHLLSATIKAFTSTLAILTARAQFHS